MERFIDRPKSIFQYPIFNLKSSMERFIAVVKTA